MGAECDAVVINYFSTLFSTFGQPNHKDILDTIPHKVDDYMNSQFNEPFNDEEIYLPVKQMHPRKAHYPDGMAPFFYQKFWHIIGKDVCPAVKRALQMGMFSYTLNHTFITLILKQNDLENVYDFQPINLCNVLYKIIAKVLAN